MKVRLNSLVLAVVILVLALSIAMSSGASPAAYADTSTPLAAPRQMTGVSGRVKYTRVQYDVRASDRYVVWTERDQSSKPEVNDLRDSTDIMGYDLKTNKPIVIATSAKPETEPDISDSIVVWQEGHCATCAMDIMGKNLDTGATFVIAASSDPSNPVDHAHPAIGGRNVAWMQGSTIMMKSIDSGILTKVATVAPNSADGFGNLRMSSTYLVWSEVNEATYKNRSIHLRAYRFSDQKIFDIADLSTSNIEYAVADHRVVWNGQGGTYLTDLDAGKTQQIYAYDMTNPFLKGDTIVWSRSNPASGNLDIWGLSLRDLKPMPLVADDASKRSPVVVGDELIWANDGTQNSGLVTSTSLSRAISSVGGRLAGLEAQARQPGQGINTGPTPTPDSCMRTRTTNGEPWCKGIFGPAGPDPGYPNQKGWDIGGAVASFMLNSGGEPYFGTIEVLGDGLGHSVGSTTIAGLMQEYQDKGAKVIVRLPTTHVPGKGYCLPHAETCWGAGSSPFDVVTDIKKLLHSDVNADQWIHNLVVDNEPSGEWEIECPEGQGCTWCGANRLYYWDGFAWGIGDFRKYYAINDFYTQVRLILANDSDPVVRNASLRFWPPAQNPDWPNPETGHILHQLLEGMIDTYGSVSYNLYPDLRNRADETDDGHVKNKTFDNTFTEDEKAQLRSEQIRSQITEFGWQPQAIGICYSQHDVWLAFAPTPAATQTPDKTSCNSPDHVDHRFEQDIDYLLRNETNGAESVNVWISRGWNPFADGITQDLTPTPWPWFATYQQSNP